MNSLSPHKESQVHSYGTPLHEAKAAVVLIHGRGATAESILELGKYWNVDGVAYLAPQAAGNTWYPQAFIAPTEANEPYLSSALEKVGSVIDYINAADIPHEHIMIGGFSQGACLASEYVARNPRRYGGLAVLSGGLIGEMGMPLEYDYDDDNNLKNTPIFMGCSDIDSHIPLSRFEETAEVLSAMGGFVSKQIYPRMGHTINEHELDQVRKMLLSILR